MKKFGSVLVLVGMVVGVIFGYVEPSSFSWFPGGLVSVIGVMCITIGFIPDPEKNKK